MATTAPKKAATSRSAKTAVDRQFVTALARGMAVLRCFDAQAHAQAWTNLIRSTAERGRGLTQIKGCELT